MTVLQLERFAVDASATDAFGSLLAELLGEMREQPGLLWADAARATDDDPSFILLSEWRTAPDADRWDDDAGLAFADRVNAQLRGEVTRRRFQG